jgi:hypothetical protein
MSHVQEVTGSTEELGGLQMLAVLCKKRSGDGTLPPTRPVEQAPTHKLRRFNLVEEVNLVEVFTDTVDLTDPAYIRLGRSTAKQLRDGTTRTRGRYYIAWLRFHIWRMARPHRGYSLLAVIHCKERGNQACYAAALPKEILLLIHTYCRIRLFVEMARLEPHEFCALMQQNDDEYVALYNRFKELRRSQSRVGTCFGTYCTPTGNSTFV